MYVEISCKLPSVQKPIQSNKRSSTWIVQLGVEDGREQNEIAYLRGWIDGGGEIGTEEGIIVVVGCLVVVSKVIKLEGIIIIIIIIITIIVIIRRRHI